eukprot:15107315-Alexandrium_andersonii.AAC.1
MTVKKGPKRTQTMKTCVTPPPRLPQPAAANTRIEPKSMRRHCTFTGPKCSGSDPSAMRAKTATAMNPIDE